MINNIGNFIVVKYTAKNDDEWIEINNFDFDRCQSKIGMIAFVVAIEGFVEWWLLFKEV